MTHEASSESDFFHNKVAVVTGGAQGIGAAIARRLLVRGATVYILDQACVETESDEVVSMECDVTSEQSVRESFDLIAEKSRRIDIVCANAGTVPEWTATENIDLDTWNRVFSVNSTGLMLTIKHSVSLFRQGSGAIIVTGSMNSWRGDPNIAAYVASKHSALGIVRSAALDLGSRGIRVNGVGPGPIATEALIRRIADRASLTGLSASEALEDLAKGTALHRLATVEDVVNTITFLASDSSAGITGQMIPVDCGAF